MSNLCDTKNNLINPNNSIADKNKILNLNSKLKFVIKTI